MVGYGDQTFSLGDGCLSVLVRVNWENTRVFWIYLFFGQGMEKSLGGHMEEKSLEDSVGKNLSCIIYICRHCCALLLAKVESELKYLGERVSGETQDSDSTFRKCTVHRSRYK